jgi:hypothetical protein
MCERGANGGTALHTAAQEVPVEIEIVRYLIEFWVFFVVEMGGKVDAGFQPLMAAAQVKFGSHSTRMVTRISFSCSWTVELII